MKLVTKIGLLFIILFSQLSAASTTLIKLSPNEPDLIGSGGILDGVYGLSNLQRVDDDIDGYWDIVGQDVTVTAVAKYAGFTEDFGFIDSNDVFTSLLYVPSMQGQSNTFTEADSGSPFRFGLKPSGSPLLSSNPLDNVLCGTPACDNGQDHMVSWLITGGDYAGDYVVAWEDLRHLGDQDYNDLVVRVSGVSVGVVPVPAAVWLFGSGLLGLAAFTRRRTKM